uniref:Putative secreted protein n=1 Tax=Ixodes ricinus TaxID=34613 RepID=A0A6B0U5Y8_IXORI
MTQCAGLTTCSHLFTAIARAAIPRFPHTRCNSFLSAAQRRSRGQLYLTPPVMEMNVDHLARGPPGPMIWIPRLPTNLN